jgi:ankyrin repeat protein
VDHRARVEATDKEGYTPLHDAVWNSHLAVAQFLIKNEALTEATDNRACTPLYVTVERG